MKPTRLDDIRLLTATVLMAAHGVVLAQEPAGEGLDLLSPSAGKFIISTSMHALVSDNFFFQPEEGTTTTVAGSIFSPSVSYSRTSAKITTKLRGAAELAAFSRGKADNYADGQVDAGLDLRPTRLLGFDTSLNYRHSHDPFGRSRTEGASPNQTDLDEWDLGRAGIRMILNDPSTTLVGLELGLGAQTKRYTTNRDATRFLDYDAFSGDIVGLFNYSPKTSFLIQYVARDVSFDNTAPGVASRDGMVQRALLGARWSATAKTSGDVRVGAARRDFDDSRREELDTVTWEAGVTWRATRRTNLRLETGQRFQESFRVEAGTIDNQFVRLTWRQDWNQRFSTTASTSGRRQEFHNTDGEDDFFTGRISANYSLDRGFDLFARFNFFTRESNRQGLDFERSDFVLGTSVQLN